MMSLKKSVLMLLGAFLLLAQKSIAQCVSENISDVAVGNPEPYRYEGAGYTAVDISSLPMHVFNVGGNSAALNQLIESVSNAGGGIITIPTGNYELVQVSVKSNVHLRFEKNVVISFPASALNIRNEKSFFMIGRLIGEELAQDITIIGEGSPADRPKFIIENVDDKLPRVFSFGKAQNVLVQNFSIEDDQSKGSSIAFNLQKNGTDDTFRAKDVTITNVSMIGAAQGFGLAQTNVGENILLKNLICTGGMTCRIEAHTGRKYDVGTDNIVIKDVVSKYGKAAVLLQPHSVVNGRVLLEGATSIGSAWTLFLREGFVASDSKRREKGEYVGSKMSGLCMQYSNSKAVISQKNIKRIPANLQGFVGGPVLGDPSTKPAEVGHNGPSVAVIFSDIETYNVEIPSEAEILVSGEDVALREKFLFTANSTLSVSEVENQINKKTYSIYPIPASQYLTIENRVSGIYSLYNAIGQLVKSFYNEDQNVQVSVLDLPKGVYFLRIPTLKGFDVKQVIVGN